MGDYATAQDLFDALSAPFPSDYIEWRVGTTNKKWRKEGEPLRGIPLCYIDARAVMDRLDMICGPDGWQCNYTPGAAASIVCNIGIRMPNGDWLWKADGAGATDMEGEKGMLSDALKRAAVRWGVGRYLYDIKAGRIELELRGETPVIPEAAHKKLNDLHEDFAVKAGWGVRAGIQAYKLLNQTVKQWVTDAVSAQDFKDKNASMIAQLPVAMRKHLYEQLDRVGAAQTEAAQ
jgi:hypothetical protein